MKGMRDLYLTEILDTSNGWDSILQSMIHNNQITDEMLGRAVRAREELIKLLEELKIIKEKKDVVSYVSSTDEQRHARLRELLDDVGVGYSYEENVMSILTYCDSPPERKDYCCHVFRRDPYS